MKKQLLWGLLLVFGLTNAQIAKVHSHNDYDRLLPFWFSYANDAHSLEADIFLLDNTLFVAHTKEEIKPENTFEKLYLNPINQLIKDNKLRPVTLLVDIKSESISTLKELIALLQKYPDVTSSKNLKLVISGNRPQAHLYKNYPDFIWFDHQNIDDLESIDLDKIALISQPFNQLSVWNGYGRMIAADFERVEKTIQKVHRAGLPIRFWATPDTKSAWSRLANLGVDYINTDFPEKAVPYLNKLDKNTHIFEETVSVYHPEYKYTENNSPKNIILMIGDGNGLAQITAGLTANKGELSLTQIKNIGLVNTSSNDDLVTDSAAGATAIATGKKTNNRAIGTAPDATTVKSLVELLSDQGYITGIISTDAIYGATPASFYAHRTERDNTNGIVTDLLKSPLDFFIAGGKNLEERISRQFHTANLDTITNLDAKYAIYLGKEKANSIEKGRGNLLAHSLKKILNLASMQDKPLFLLVEGAQIDNGGHENNIQKIIEELIDFDKTIAAALAFADRNNETLVVVTADHETSGLGIMNGDLKKGAVQADFLSVDHSGILVPLFAYGPQANNFNGVYHNHKIFSKLLEATK